MISDFQQWLPKRQLQDIITQVFGDVQPENGVYWIPFLDKTIYIELKEPDSLSPDKPYVILAFFNTEDLGSADLSSVGQQLQPSTMPLLRKLQELGGLLARAEIRLVYSAEQRKTVDGIEKEPTDQRRRVFDRIFKTDMSGKGVVDPDSGETFQVWDRNN